jgi:hypothetical protein
VKSGIDRKEHGSISQEERSQMSSNDPLGAPEPAQENPGDNADRDDSSVASKLSKELSNWRRQRNVARPRRPEMNGGGSNSGSEPARTIRVRGHETLVVRKPKLAPKPSSNQNQSDNG